LKNRGNNAKQKLALPRFVPRFFWQYPDLNNPQKVRSSDGRTIKKNAKLALPSINCSQQGKAPSHKKYACR